MAEGCVKTKTPHSDVGNNKSNSNSNSNSHRNRKRNSGSDSDSHSNSNRSSSNTNSNHRKNMVRCSGIVKKDYCSILAEWAFFDSQ